MGWDCDMHEEIKRRIEFLIEAAKYEVKKDQVVTYAMRVLSNHATIGRDAGSAEIKKHNKTVSQGAQKLLHSVDLTTFCKQTINEHPKPILATWEWLRENAEHLSVEEVWNEFVANKMVTITKEEDTRIRASGQNSIGNMQTRYNALGIRLVTLSKTPYQFHKDLKARGQ